MKIEITKELPPLKRKILDGLSTMKVPMCDHLTKIASDLSKELFATIEKSKKYITSPTVVFKVSVSIEEPTDEEDGDDECD